MSDDKLNPTITKKVETVSSNLKIIKICAVIVAILVIGWITWYSLNLINGVLTEGNPNISFAEVNETMANSHNISHLTDQEYKDFPKLSEMVENSKADLTWYKGSRYLGNTKISQNQKDFIIGKYSKENVIWWGTLEYKEKYFTYTISLS